jgi:hypothetical protein
LWKSISTIAFRALKQVKFSHMDLSGKWFAHMIFTCKDCESLYFSHCQLEIDSTNWSLSSKLKYNSSFSRFVIDEWADFEIKYAQMVPIKVQNLIREIEKAKTIWQSIDIYGEHSTQPKITLGFENRMKNNVSVQFFLK